MIRLNLLPVRQLKKRIKAKKELVAFFISIVAVITILATLNVWQQKSIDQVNNEIIGLNNEKKRLTPILNRIKRLEQTKKNLDQKFIAINALKNESNLAVRIMDEVAASTPANRLWLNSFVFATGSLRLAGIALDNATVAQYMSRLRRSPYIATVELENSTLKTIEGLQLTTYSLRCQLDQPQAKDEKTVKAATNK